MDSIWREWEGHYKRLGINVERVCKDGIINPVKFSGASKRVLFLLKDINNRGVDDPSHGVRDLPQWLRNGPRHQLWHTVAKWSAGVLNNFPPYETLGEKIVNESFAKIAAINLKKACGGARVNSDVIAAYTHQDRNFLLRQIHFIKPDLIISCGVLEPLIWLLDLKVNPEYPSEHPVRDEARGAWVIPFRHPARAAGKKIYEQLKKILSMVDK